MLLCLTGSLCLPCSTSAQSAAGLLPDAPGAQDTRSDTASPPQNSSTPAASFSGGPLAGGHSAEDYGEISGTVADTNGDIVSGATVALDGAGSSEHRTITSNDNGAFQFDTLRPGIPYRLTVSARGFRDWKSNEIRLQAGQFQFITGIRLPILGDTTSIIVTAGTQEEIATEQVHLEEQQRVLGFVPNFYVVYDAKNAVPLTTKLKYQMAFRVSIDPVSIFGAAFLAGIYQAADTPDYQQGWKGYGQRFGAVYASGVTDTMIGGAILPSLLHQDPRYFYQGTGTIRSRMKHALSGPFICKGDNGQWQPNYSSVGGDLLSEAIANAYYPASNRGLGVTFQNFATDTAEREVSTLLQEFIIRKLTPGAKKQK